MRLICPNCGAQYEVSDDVIPVAGRDVQCSNCGHTWFEEPGASAMAEAGETDLVGRTVRPRPAPKPMPRPPAPPPAPAIAASDDEPATFADVPEVDVPPRPSLRVPKRTISPQIADILREEAAREEAARRAEAQAGLEIQGELGLRDTSAEDHARADAARREMLARSAAVEAALHPSEPEPAIETQPEPLIDPATAAVTSVMSAAAQMPDPVPAPVSAATPNVPPSNVPRRDLLPDIEEINSSLRSAAERGPAVAEQATVDTTAKSRGFRYGFSLILLIAAVLAMVYVYTPRLIVVMPAAAPILEPYADAVDSGRLWLDLELQDLLKLIAPDETAPAAE